MNDNHRGFGFVSVWRENINALSTHGQTKSAALRESFRARAKHHSKAKQQKVPVERKGARCTFCRSSVFSIKRKKKEAFRRVLRACRGRSALATPPRVLELKKRENSSRREKRALSLDFSAKETSCSCSRSKCYRVVVHDEAPWLILPVVICLSQRLSHACLSACRIKVKPRMAH